MFGRAITLFKLLDFEIRVDSRWFIIAALVTWSLAVGFFPLYYPGLPASAYFWMGVAGALLPFGSIVVHELFHSLVARRYGIPMRGITLFRAVAPARRRLARHPHRIPDRLGIWRPVDCLWSGEPVLWEFC